jgi:putative intracellular protease/amidase
VLTHPFPAGSPKRRALIVLSSARTLPLREPSGHPGLSTGFFLVELARVLREFEQDYEFTFATPDGLPPQLDVNGLALPFHAGRMLGPVTALALAELAGRADVHRYRNRHARLVERRESELRLARAHLGRIPVSELLPNSDKDVRLLRDEVAESFDALPERPYLSLPELIRRHRDLSDRFSLADFDFVHMPGGHASMVDFVDNPWMGELLNSLYENGVIISLICHAPVALTSAKFRISAFGTTQAGYRNPFTGVRLTAASEGGERLIATTGFAKVPGRRTRVTYSMVKALREAGYRVRTTLDPAAVKVVWDAPRQLLTGNGPQTVDAQTARLRAILGRTGGSSSSKAVSDGELVACTGSAG